MKEEDMMITSATTTKEHLTEEEAKLLPLIAVKRCLNVSWERMAQIVRDGKMTVYNVSREPLTLQDIRSDTTGLRVRAEDLQTYIESIRVL